MNGCFCDKFKKTIHIWIVFLNLWFMSFRKTWFILYKKLIPVSGKLPNFSLIFTGYFYWVDDWHCASFHYWGFLLFNPFSIRSSHRRCSIEKGVLKNSKNSQENTCDRGSSLIKFQPSACNYIQKEILTQVFSCEFWEWLRGMIDIALLFIIKAFYCLTLFLSEAATGGVP